MSFRLLFAVVVFHIKLVKPLSDVSKFKELITQKGYPHNQNVIRLDNLPADSNEDIVRCLFPGKFIMADNSNEINSHVSRDFLEIGIEKICFPECETGKNTVEVFVVLSDLNDVEKVLKMNGKKIDSNVIKMFRSCHEQLEYRCASLDSALDSNSSDFDVQPHNSNINTEKRLSQEAETGNMNTEWIRVSAPEIFPSKELRPLDADTKAVRVFIHNKLILNEINKMIIIIILILRVKNRFHL